MSNRQDKLKDLHGYLNEKFGPKSFVLADGYIFGGFKKKIHFDLFIGNENIGLKYPKPNLTKSKIDQLSIVIYELDTRFKYREYDTTPKSKYSIWEIDVTDFDKSEIEKFIKTIDKIYI
jgi:hypothetical protein